MIGIWVGFIALVIMMLALDLGVFHRKAKVISVKEALTWSGVWLSMGLSFAVFVYFAYNGSGSAWAPPWTRSTVSPTTA